MRNKLLNKVLLVEKVLLIYLGRYLYVFFLFCFCELNDEMIFKNKI